MKKMAIIGTGGFAKEVLWLIDDIGRYDEVECFMEPDDVWKERSILGIPVRPQSEFDAGVLSAVLAIGAPHLREKIVTTQLPENTEYPVLIHPQSGVPKRKWYEVGPGSMICCHSIVTCDVVIGQHVHINCQTTVGHDTIIGDFTTTTGGTRISGECNIGKRTYWGNNASIRQGLPVCDDVTIGMGATIVKPITEPGIYVGIPAKKLERK
jgi:sugar O-acyltransferase (sialic acid O-acetyltransferase NeuD family)